MARETFQIRGLAETVAALNSLPAELVSKAGGPVKSALLAGSRILLDAAKANVRAIIAEPNENGDDRSTGLLLLSLQAKRVRMPTGVRGEAVKVGIRSRQKYPSFRQNKNGDITAAQVGRLLEYGSERQTPKPWLRPAFEAQRGRAVQVFEDTLRKRVNAVIAKLDRQQRANA